jgi:hypothetical protein
MRRLGWISCVLVLALATISCEKLETKPAGGTTAGPLKFETSRFADAIPLDYGDLIAVTQNPQAGRWAALWFSKPDKSVAVVFVDTENGKIFEKSLLVPRR